jgi:hypothetical protein
MGYIDQIADFIEQNAGGVKLGSSGNVDPFTGASSYVFSVGKSRKRCLTSERISREP